MTKAWYLDHEEKTYTGLEINRLTERARAEGIRLGRDEYRTELTGRLTEARALFLEPFLKGADAYYRNIVVEVLNGMLDWMAYFEKLSIASTIHTYLMAVTSTNAEGEFPVIRPALPEE